MKTFFLQRLSPIVSSVIIIGSVAISGFALSIYSYTKKISYLEFEVKELTSELENSRRETEKRLQSLAQVSDNLKVKSGIMEEIIIAQQTAGGTVFDKLGQISHAVEELKKVSSTDGELLKKYSKIYFLNEHYVPLSLSNIDPKYMIANSKPMQIHANVYPRLVALLEASNESGLSLRVESAFRSFSTQAQLKSAYKVIYGAGTANQFSADQGYSEHQLGTTVDFTSGTKGGLSGFETKPEYTWLKNNAHKYGFILSYPPNNSYYKFEPWHWRYVGLDLATKLAQDNMYFYNMDQRVIDSYISKFFD
ncbi:MAG: M15 family metallopeptidase [Candidatus Pacebacteria bacterium]|nr:M15 family metallopeptidase [Candidatus Paceibacterota bacterium]